MSVACSLEHVQTFGVVLICPPDASLWFTCELVGNDDTDDNNN